jgi:predicted AAA+ superfamily ATPase
MFLLTGSADVWATLRISESLAGRAERIRLWPLSQGEIEGRRERALDQFFESRPPRPAGVAAGRSSIASRIAAGGYPEMVARPEPRRRARWTQSYLGMILERDVSDLTTRARQLDELPRLLELSAARVGSLVDLTGLGRDAQMKRDSVSRYLRLLELLFLVRRLPAWSVNLGQRLIKAPKMTLPDSGLAAQLTGYEATRFDDLDDSFCGALFENFVVGEVTKQATWAEREVRLHHFRTAGGREVDLVLEDRSGSVVGLEAKLGATPQESDFRGLAHLRDRLGERFRAGLVLNTGSATLPFGDRLWAAPAAALWAG